MQGHERERCVLSDWVRPRVLACLLAVSLAGVSKGMMGTAGDSEAERVRIERIAQEVMADVEQQSAGRWGGSELVRLSFGLQTRHLVNAGADGESGNGRDWESGFIVPKARVMLRGELPDTPLSYYIAGDFTPGGDAMELIDAYVNWKLDDVWQLRLGQFKGPLVRETDLASSFRSLFVDTSIVARAFRLSYAQGLQLSGTGDRARGFFAFTDGRGSANTEFTDDREAEAALTVRGEWRLGEAGWRQYSDLTAFPDEPTGALIGVAGHWQQGGATTVPAALGEHANLWVGTTDLSIEGDGWNAMASAVGRIVEGRGESLTDLGVMAQGGAFVTERVEVMGRYAHVFPDSDRGPNADDFSAWTVGMNYYLLPKSHAAKLTAEVTWYPTAQGDSSALISASDTIGLLRDEDGGQWAFVVQMQLMF